MIEIRTWLLNHYAEESVLQLSVFGSPADAHCRNCIFFDNMRVIRIRPDEYDP
jgi:hypothetical protein